MEREYRKYFSISAAHMTVLQNYEVRTPATCVHQPDQLAVAVKTSKVVMMQELSRLLSLAPLSQLAWRPERSWCI